MPPRSFRQLQSEDSWNLPVVTSLSPGDRTKVKFPADLISIAPYQSEEESVWRCSKGPSSLSYILVFVVSGFLLFGFEVSQWRETKKWRRTRWSLRKDHEWLGQGVGHEILDLKKEIHACMVCNSLSPFNSAEKHICAQVCEYMLFWINNVCTLH